MILGLDLRTNPHGSGGEKKICSRIRSTTPVFCALFSLLRGSKNVSKNEKVEGKLVTSENPCLAQKSLFHMGHNRKKQRFMAHFPCPIGVKIFFTSMGVLVHTMEGPSEIFKIMIQDPKMAKSCTYNGPWTGITNKSHGSRGEKRCVHKREMYVR